MRDSCRIVEGLFFSSLDLEQPITTNMTKQEFPKSFTIEQNGETVEILYQETTKPPIGQPCYTYNFTLEDFKSGKIQKFFGDEFVFNQFMGMLRKKSNLGLKYTIKIKKIFDIDFYKTVLKSTGNILDNELSIPKLEKLLIEEHRSIVKLTTAIFIAPTAKKKELKSVFDDTMKRIKDIETQIEMKRRHKNNG